jgi:hypothetical protein
MCFQTYTHFSLCDCVAVHTHQCVRIENAINVIFCRDYTVRRQTAEGGCPKHRDRVGASPAGSSSTAQTGSTSASAQQQQQQQTGSGGTAQGHLHGAGAGEAARAAA